jgi:hypothetical protein
MADSVIEPSYSPLSQKNDKRGIPFGNPGREAKKKEKSFLATNPGICSTLT